MLLIGSVGMTSCGKLGRCSDGRWGRTLFKDLFSFVNWSQDLVFTMSPLGEVLNKVLNMEICSVAF
jgi:hypothetical protein